MLSMEIAEYLLRRQKKQIIERSRRIAVVGAAAQSYYRSYVNTEKLISYGLTVLPVLAGQSTYLGVACYAGHRSNSGRN
jgi:predicted CoA-binding protein